MVPADPPLGGDERAELERLRAENAALRSALPAAPPAGAGTGRWRWRAVVATLLIVVGCVLAPLSVAAVWTRNQVTDTDRYVATVAPLARDPAIQQAIADRITAQVLSYLDVPGLTNQVVDALAERGLGPVLATQLRALAGPIASGLEGFTHDQVMRVVESDAFADAWAQANRVVHDELVKALTGEGDGAVTVQGDTVSLNLAPIIAVVKQRLVDQGFALAARVPEVDASFVLFQSEAITRAHRGFSLLNTLGMWLPVVAIVLLVSGVYVAADQRRALVGAGVGLAGSMVVLALGLAVFRSIYLDSVPPAVLPHDAAAVLYDTIVRFLRLGLRTVLVVGLVVAAGAFLTGPSPTATRVRAGLPGAIGWGADRAGLPTGRAGAWVGANRRALRVGAVALACLALVFWGRPTGKVVLGLTLALLVVLALVELLGRRPAGT